MLQKTTNSFTIITIFILLSLAGLVLLPKLPVQLKPEYNYQTIGVSYSYSGASPRTIEEKVTSIIEARLALLREVKNVRSVSGNGFGRVTADIDEKADINLASHEVSQIISNIYPLLPKGLSYPNVYIWGNSPGESPVLTYSVLTDKNDEGLATIMEEYVIEPLQQVKGVGEVQLHGITPFRWNIIIDYNKMLNLGIPYSDAYYALRLEQVQIPLGQASVNNNTDKQVVIKGMYGGSPEEIRKIPVHTGKEGHITYLEDIAVIKREAVSIVLCADSGFADQKAYEIFEQELHIHYIITGKLYNDVTEYVKDLPIETFGKISKDKAVWQFAEFASRLKSWSKFRRCFFTSVMSNIVWRI